MKVDRRKSEESSSSVSPVICDRGRRTGEHNRLLSYRARRIFSQDRQFVSYSIQLSVAHTEYRIENFITQSTRGIVVPIVSLSLSLSLSDKT